MILRNQGENLIGTLLRLVIVLVTGLISGLGHGFYGTGFRPLQTIASELGFTRAAIPSLQGSGDWRAALTPHYRLAFGRFGPKWIMVFGLSMMSVGLP